MKDVDLNRCQSCGHDADTHGPGGQCSNRPNLLEDPCTCETFIPAHRITTRVLSDAWYRTVAAYLDEHPDPPAGPDGRPYWRPSMLGYCLRRQVLWRRGVPDTRVEDPNDESDKLRRFAWGRELEKKFAEQLELSGLLISRQVHLADEDLAVQGSADLLWGGQPQRELPDRSRYWSPEYVWAVQSYREEVGGLTQDRSVPVTLTEIKSTHSHNVRKAYKEGPRFDYRCQLGSYGLVAHRHPEQLPSYDVDRFELVVVGRDAVRPLCFGLTGTDIRMAEDRLGTLNEWWRSGDLPPCTCDSLEEITFLQSRYCPYQDPQNPSECCQTTLLDRLEASVARVRA